MGRLKIKDINEFYKYIEANILEHPDSFNLKIDIDDTNDFDKYQIQLIVSCLLYTIRCGELSPLFTYNNGDTYPNIKTLDDNDVEYLKNCINGTKNFYIKAHISHFLFIKSKIKNRIEFAKEAINSYFELFKILEPLQDEKWSELSLTFNNLSVLTSKTKYRTEDFKDLAIDIAKTSNIKVLVRDAIEFLIDRVKRKKFKKTILKGLISRCKYFIKNSDSNINWVESFVKFGKQISTINQTNSLQWDLLQARYYEKEIKCALKYKNNEMAAAHWCQKAIKYYKNGKDKIKAERLYQKYILLCKEVELQTIKGETIDLSEKISKIKDYIDKSSVYEVIQCLLSSFIPQYQYYKETVENKNLESSLSKYFPINYSDIYGQVVGYAHTDEEVFKHNLYEMYEQANSLNTILVFHYIKYAIEQNKITDSNIIAFLKNSWLGKIIRKPVSNNQTLIYQWLEHLEEPIRSFYKKHKLFQNNNLYRLSFINETDTLTLKIEGILRDIIEFSKIKDFNLRKFKNDNEGREISTWKTINELLWEDKIFEVLDEDDVWFFRFLLTDFLNLRNNIAHCLVLSPYQVQYHCGIYWLIIILLRLSQVLTITET